jgi:hypothetical protein
MDNKCSNNVCDEVSLSRWREKMSRLNRSLTFGKRTMAKGRMAWAANAIKSVRLQLNWAEALVKYNGEDCKIDFNADDTGELESDSDLEDNKFSAIIYAICLEIDLLISTHVTVDEVAEPECNGSFLESKPIEGNKCLLVKTAIEGQNLVLRSFLDNDPRKPIVVQTNSN